MVGEQTVQPQQLFADLSPQAKDKMRCIATWSRSKWDDWVREVFPGSDAGQVSALAEEISRFARDAAAHLNTGEGERLVN
jgi:hypothetical protein